MLRKRRGGLTVLELMVTVSIISILVAILLPAVGAARESARRIICLDHFREIGLSLHNHHFATKQLPVGWSFDESRSSAYGWAVPMLSYLGESGLRERIDVSVSIQSPLLEAARQTSLPGLLCPSDIARPTFVLYQSIEVDDDVSVSAGHSLSNASPIVQLPTANYVGVFGTIEPDNQIPAPVGDGTFLENRRVRFRDFERGLSQTIIVGERTMASVPSTWLGVDLAGEDAAARLVGATLEGINHPLADECEFSSRHPGGANFLWGDGHVGFISESIDLREYHSLARLKRN